MAEILFEAVSVNRLGLETTMRKTGNIKPCATCENGVYRRGSYSSSRRFCNRSCWGSRQRKVVAKHCLVCQKEFFQHPTNKNVHCSDDCRYNLARRFWSRVQKGEASECWLWRGSRRVNGYGVLGVNGGTKVATHIIWKLTHGYWPVFPSQLILHSCDVPACINPAHLRLGTHEENMEDRMLRKRQVYGSRCHTTKLTELQVGEIRVAYMKFVKQLAPQYGVTRANIRYICDGKTWKGVKI